MLEIPAYVSPRKRQQMVKFCKQSSFSHQNKESLLSHPLGFPSKGGLKCSKNKISESFKVCASKNVFVFSKKEFTPDGKRKGSVRHFWKNHDQMIANEEVFIPPVPQKKILYRILPKTSYGRRGSLNKPKQIERPSTQEIRRSIHWKPEPWESSNLEPEDHQHLF